MKIRKILIFLIVILTQNSALAISVDELKEMNSYGYMFRIQNLGESILFHQQLDKILSDSNINLMIPANVPGEYLHDGHNYYLSEEQFHFTNTPIPHWPFRYYDPALDRMACSERPFSVVLRWVPNLCGLGSNYYFFSDFYSGGKSGGGFNIWDFRQVLRIADYNKKFIDRYEYLSENVYHWDKDFIAGYMFTYGMTTEGNFILDKDRGCQGYSKRDSKFDGGVAGYYTYYNAEDAFNSWNDNNGFQTNPNPLPLPDYDPVDTKDMSEKSKERLYPHQSMRFVKWIEYRDWKMRDFRKDVLEFARISTDRLIGAHDENSTSAFYALSMGDTPRTIDFSSTDCTLGGTMPCNANINIPETAGDQQCSKNSAINWKTDYKLIEKAVREGQKPMGWYWRLWWYDDEEDHAENLMCRECDELSHDSRDYSILTSIKIDELWNRIGPDATTPQVAIIYPSFTSSAWPSEGGANLWDTFIPCSSYRNETIFPEARWPQLEHLIGETFRIPYEIIPYYKIKELGEKLKMYRLILIPNAEYLDADTLNVLNNECDATLVFTGLPGRIYDDARNHITTDISVDNNLCGFPAVKRGSFSGTINNVCSDFDGILVQGEMPEYNIILNLYNYWNTIIPRSLTAFTDDSKSVILKWNMILPGSEHVSGKEDTDFGCLTAPVVTIRDAQKENDGRQIWVSDNIFQNNSIVCNSVNEWDCEDRNAGLYEYDQEEYISDGRKVGQTFNSKDNTFIHKIELLYPGIKVLTGDTANLSNMLLIVKLYSSENPIKSTVDVNNLRLDHIKHIRFSDIPDYLSNSNKFEILLNCPIPASHWFYLELSTQGSAYPNRFYFFRSNGDFYTSGAGYLNGVESDWDLGIGIFGKVEALKRQLMSNLLNYAGCGSPIFTGPAPDINNEHVDIYGVNSQYVSQTFRLHRFQDNIKRCILHRAGKLCNYTGDLIILICDNQKNIIADQSILNADLPVYSVNSIQPVTFEWDTPISIDPDVEYTMYFIASGGDQSNCFVIDHTDTGNYTSEQESFSGGTASVNGEQQSWDLCFSLESFSDPLVTGLSATSIQQYQVSLRWDAIQNVDSYSIFRADTRRFKPSYNNMICTVPAAQNPSFTDKTVLPEKTYYYKIAGIESRAFPQKQLFYSCDEEIMVTTPKDTQHPSSIPGSALTIRTINAFQIYLQWPPQQNIEYYNIYRADITGLIEARYIASVKNPPYTDVNLQPDQTYAYYVEAVDYSGNVPLVLPQLKSCTTPSNVRMYQCNFVCNGTDLLDPTQVHCDLENWELESGSGWEIQLTSEPNRIISENGPYSSDITRVSDGELSVNGGGVGYWELPGKVMNYNFEFDFKFDRVDSMDGMLASWVLHYDDSNKRKVLCQISSNDCDITNRPGNRFFFTAEGMTKIVPIKSIEAEKWYHVRVEVRYDIFNLRSNVKTYVNENLIDETKTQYRDGYVGFQSNGMGDSREHTHFDNVSLTKIR